MRKVSRVVGAVVVGLAGTAGCDAEPEVDRVVIDDRIVADDLTIVPPGSGDRCSIKGEPPVTTGCDADEVCRPYACTFSIPPTCVGTCEEAPEEKAKRCDVNGDPPVTTGCGPGETCAVEACTNSIPPHCWGHCE